MDCGCLGDLGVGEANSFRNIDSLCSLGTDFGADDMSSGLRVDGSFVDNVSYRLGDFNLNFIGNVMSLGFNLVFNISGGIGETVLNFGFLSLDNSAGLVSKGLLFDCLCLFMFSGRGSRKFVGLKNGVGKADLDSVDDIISLDNLGSLDIFNYKR